MPEIAKRREGGPVGNLPAELSSFVGRRRELSEIERLVKSARLVTVTGMGGVGKTRTGLRAAADLSTAFPDGVWLTELSGLRDPALLGHAVAQAIGLQDQTVRPQIDVLAELLADRSMLLVLDTCEHLLDNCAMLVEVLLAACPRLRILATSRRPLGLPDEAVYTIRPLPVPDPGSPQTEDAATDSVVLFMERARAADAGFEPRPESQAAVVKVCHRLDGIPLAIELAAVWLPTLSVEQIAERLDHRLGLLSGGSGTLARHETLRAAIGWSHELCEPLERLLWARLAVFAGTFDIATAQAICADSRLPADAVPGLLAGLADKSVLMREADPTADETAGKAAGKATDRYRLLDTMREYGEGWLDALNERKASQRLHRDHYLALAQRCEAEFCGPGQVDWCSRLGREHADLRAALEFSLSDPDEHQAGLELAGSLYLFWVPSGLITEGRHYLDRALSLDLPPSPALAKALSACARLAITQGDFVIAETLIERCRPYAEQGDLTSAGYISYVTGAIAMARGELDQAAPALAEATELHRRGGDTSIGLLFSMVAHGMTLALRRDFDPAVERLEECRELCERHGERWVRSFADYIRGLAELGRGAVAEATRYGRESLRFKPLLPDRLGTSLALDLLAASAVAAGDAARAARLIGFADHLWHTFGLPQLGAPELVARREQCVRRAREALGHAAFEAAVAEGREFEVTAGIGYALGEERPVRMMSRA